jgi:2'-5' RNA ligase
VSATRYGFYLRPSPAMCRAQAEIHALLERQYGLRAAGRFMPHATIKGFFRSDASQAELEAGCARAVAGRAAFTIFNQGVVPFGTSGIALHIQRLPSGEPNGPLQALHEAAWAALTPHIHPECDFTPREGAGPRFDAHLTLAMADIPRQLFDEVLAFLRELEPIGPASFRADTLQLFAFTSTEWGGPWWETLRWIHLASWRLA